MTRAARGLAAAVLLLAGLESAVARQVERDPVEDPPVLEPGARGMTLTVLAGQRPTEIPLTFLGTYEDFGGPGFDLHLVQLEGPEAERVGVAAGMSGSPVYIDGRLIGALAYRLGALPKSPVAGVTPIENMLEALPAPVPRGGRGEAGVSPIMTPVVAGGLSPDVREWLAPRLEELGLVLVAGGGGGIPGGGSPVLFPGSPVGVEMVRGDLRMAATGTVTWVDGDRVYAFGHPFLGSGRSEMPMVAAEVIHTLADAAGSIKLANVGAPLGAIVEDRHAAIVGRLGEQARMIPLALDVEGGDYGRQAFHFEIVRQSPLTPLLTAVSVVNALRVNNGFSAESTLRVRGRIDLGDLPDLTVEMAYAGVAGDPSFGVASELLATLGALWTNPFAEIEVQGLELSVEAQSEIQSYRLEDLLYTREAVRPGETVDVACVLRRYRGVVTTETFSLVLPDPLPEGGGLMLAVGNPTDVDRLLGGELARRFQTATDPAAYVRVLGEAHPANRLTAVIYEPGRSVVADGTAYAALPPSAERLLETQVARNLPRRSPRVTPLSQATRDLAGPVQGALRVRLQVKSPAHSRDSR